MNRYVELHARSAFSFLEGAVHPDALAFGCTQLGIPATALLDRNGVYGAPFFHQTMKANGLKAHVGAAISINSPLFANAPYLPLLGTNVVLYAPPEGREILGAFTCIKNKPTLESSGRVLSTNAGRGLRSSAPMSRLFCGLPGGGGTPVEPSARLTLTREQLGYK